MENYQQILTEIDYTIRQNKDYEYKWQISKAKSNDDDWTIAIAWNDGSFITKVKQVIDKFDADALKIELSYVPMGHKNPKKSDPYYIRLTDTHIKVLDEKAALATQAQQISNTLSITHDELNGLVDRRAEEKAALKESQLMGLVNQKMEVFDKQREQEKIERIKEKHELQIEKIELHHANILKEKERQIELLTQKNSELESELDEVGSYVEELEAKQQEEAGSGNIMETILNGISMFTGKGGGTPVNSLDGANGSPIENLSPEQQARAQQNAKIYQWLISLDEFTFKKVASIFIEIDQHPAIMDDIIEYVAKLIPIPNGEVV